MHEYKSTPTTELEDFIVDISRVMQYWLDIHTDRAAWTELWLMDMSPSEVAKEFGGKTSNNYYSFDWRAAAVKLWCERNTHNYYTCANCGCINKNGTPCELEEECENADQHDVHEDDLFYYVQDAYYGEEVYYLLSDEDWREALEGDGFDTYRDAMSRHTSAIEDEVSEVLEAISSATDIDDLITAITWALHVAHVNGFIIKDYADETPGVITSNLYDKLNDVQQYGLSEVFDQSDIDSFFGVTPNKADA